LKETFFAIGYLFVLVAIAGGILYLWDRISDTLWRRRNPPEKLATEWQEYQGRIQAPDWDFYTNHLQREVPTAIRKLFSNTAIVLSQNAECCGDQIINRFGAIDEANLLESKEWIGTDVVAIAHNKYGDPIHLLPGTHEANAVFVTYHDGGDIEQISADISEFVDSIRPTDSAE